ncbi:MAG: helix-turn-helix transcriptional regulator [Ruminococcaceae bacterium]|nr:helix-turn-helix transcriptional regulator [Oscillospiraceae bacterium]
MIGARIAALRREAGMSQSRLAQLLQVSPSAVGMYEQGRREPSAEILVELARIFHVSVDYILTGVPAEQETDDLQRMLLSRITSADRRLTQRTDRPFSREELAVLFAAMLMEP